MTANLYGNYDRSDVQDRLHGDLAHFARKHGVIPTVVRMHPDLLPPQVDEIVIQSEKGKMVHIVKLIGDPTQRPGTYLIAREEE
jgi:hypothetical protein